MFSPCFHSQGVFLFLFFQRCSLACLFMDTAKHTRSALACVIEEVELLRRSDLLQYPEVTFDVKAHTEIHSLIRVDEWNVDAVRFFYLSFKKFDVVGWLNVESGKVDWLNKTFFYLFHKKNIFLRS